VAQLDLPAGSYTFVASLRATNGSGDTAKFYCDLGSQNQTTEQISDILGAHDADAGATSMAVTGADTLTADGNVSLRCASQLGAEVTVREIRLVATQVGTLVQQP
jgi:hypothetical protein